MKNEYTEREYKRDLSMLGECERAGIDVSRRIRKGLKGYCSKDFDYALSNIPRKVIILRQYGFRPVDEIEPDFEKDFASAILVHNYLHSYTKRAKKRRGDEERKIAEKQAKVNEDNKTFEADVKLENRVEQNRVQGFLFRGLDQRSIADRGARAGGAYERRMYVKKVGKRRLERGCS